MHYSNPKVLFHGKRVDLLSIDVKHPKGGIIQREVVDHPGAVVILPLLDDDRVILIRNERYVVQETLWELPAGTLEAGEEPLACAERELEEETGYRSGTISPLFECYSTPGFCNEKLFIFLAKDLTQVGQNLDATEKIEVVPTLIEQAHKMMRNGEIRDAKTIAALLYIAYIL
ncbi:MAG: ADP-ribose pyrophosphatase [Chlamydiales bacterium]|nr:ADP-ribose pyrophosphatase [Chlamydiales bacterium]